MNTMKHNWEYKKLGDCFAYIKNGANIKQDKSNVGYPITRIETLSNGVFNRDKVGFAGITELGKYQQNILCDKDLLMSHINSKTYVGRTVVYDKLGDEKIIHGMNLLRLVPLDNLLSDFFQYHTQSLSFKAAIARIRKDAVNQSSFAIGDLVKIPIPLPPLPIQQKIVAELDKVSLIIDKKKQQLKELDKLAQAIFYDMFGDPVENEKGWDVKKLDEVCDVRDGTHDSPKYIDGGEYILITSKNIVNGKIDYSNISYITKEDYDAINKRSKVDDGDIIMAMIGTIGKPIIVKMENYKFCIKNVALIKFLKDSMVSNVYIQALLNSSSFSQHIMSKNQGGTQKFVSLGTIRKLEIPLPPLALQQSFAAKIEAIEKQKELISRSIKEAQTLFDERMDYWFD